MSVWPLVRLSDVATFSGGGKLKLSKQHYVSEGFPAFSAAGQDGYVATAEFHAPAIIVSAIGARCGKAFLAEGAWTSLANTYCVFPDVSKADPRFIWYQLNDENSWKKSGSAQPFIKPTDIKERQIPLPPLEEQRRIVGLLDRAAEIRRRADAARAKARAIIPALFLNMFGDPATNPKGWPVLKLEQIADVSYGSAAKLNTLLTESDGRRIITISNVQVEGLIDASVRRFYPASAEDIRKYSVRTGDLLFNWRNGSVDHVGKTAIVPASLDGCLHVSFLLKIRCRENKESAHFLWALLNMLRAQGYFKDNAREQINRKFNASELSALMVGLPPLSLQAAFTEQAQRLEAIARTLDAAAAKAEAMAAALSAEIFETGSRAALCDAA